MDDGTNPLLLFIRESNDWFQLYPYRKGATEKQILQIVTEAVANEIADCVHGYFDERDRKISTSTAVRRIMEYANEHHKFWELVEDSGFYHESFSNRCKYGETLKDAVKKATEHLNWKMLVEKK